MAEGVLGAAKDGGVKALTVARAVHHHLSAVEPTPNIRVPPPTLPLGVT